MPSVCRRMGRVELAQEVGLDRVGVERRAVVEGHARRGW